MVSPCKKKYDKKGKASVSQQNRGTSSIRKENKPLANKKFYLDIRNQASSKKLEEQIISLGGAIETFLVCDVSYVVTDRKSQNGSSPHPLSASSPSPSDAAPHSTRTRSRGEAMLFRVKQQPLTPSLDDSVFERAAAFNIPVYPLLRFTEYLSKLVRRAERAASTGCGLRELRGSFLKLETGLRPEFRVLSGGWPRIDLTRGSQGAAFASPNHDTNNHTSSRMTRKSGSKLLAATAKNSSSNAGAGGAGYCEVCRVNYTWLEEHLSSVGHIKAVTDPTQYQELDSLITASGGWLGTGPRKSLRIAKSPPPNQQSPPPPTILHCNGHQTATPTPQQGLSNGVNLRRSSERKSPRGRVVRKRLSAEEKLIEDNRAYYKVEVLNSKLRSTGCLQRQLSSSREEDDEEDTSSEEEKETTGRMGGILGSSSLPNGQTNNTLNDSVVVRFKKVRKSELTVLSDEAENFMFGVDRKDEQSQQDESNEETTKKKRRTQAEVFINDNTDYYKFELAGSRLRYQGTTLAHVPTPPKEDRLGKYPGRDESTQSMLRSGKSPHNEDHTLSRLRSAAGKSPPKEDSFHPRLRSGGKSPPQEDTAHTRLRSAAGKSPPRNQVVKEVVPHPHSRLRSIDTPPPLEPRLRSCPGLTPVKENPAQRLCPLSEDDPAPELTLSHTDITYAFELSNTDGVWAEVCERFDNYQEEVLPHYYSYPSVVLPSEMSYLERLKLLTRRRRRMSRGFDDKPRKSPRCHASTLAIMSSVLPKSRLCETQPVQQTPPPPPTPPVPTAVEDEDTTTSSLTAESSVSDPNHDSRAILQRYMQHYLSLLDSAQPKAMTPRPWDPSEGCDDVLHTPEATPDFLTMMDNNDCPTMDVCTQETLFQLRSFDATTLDSCNSSDCSEIFGFSEDGRSFFGRRKKKKRHNLTGWPKEKPRRNKFLNFAKKSRVIKSEPIDPNDPETESSNIVENFVLSFADMRNELSQFKKKRGRPRIYPPGMSPSVLKVKLARESAALKRSSSVSPVKHRPSLKAHPL